MQKGLWRTVALNWAASALLAWPACQALATGTAGDKSPQAHQPQDKPAKAAGSSQASKVTPASKPGGSAESPADRAARLKRECRGAVNAGACTGYTQ